MRLPIVLPCVKSVWAVFFAALLSCTTAFAQNSCDTCIDPQPELFICADVINPVCGCDGTTYNNSCEAENAGVQFWSEGRCQSSSACVIGPVIPDAICVAVYDPVCGCDNKTYTNSCAAESSGLAKWSRGACDSSPVLMPPVGVHIEVHGRTLLVDWESSETAIGYNVYVDGRLADSTTSSRAYVELTEGNTYVVYVTSVGVSGEESEQSNIATAYIPEFSNSQSSPIRIEAESFSEASGVDVEATSDVGGGQQVSGLEGGDALHYRISVPEAGSIQLDYRVATNTYGGNFNVLLNNQYNRNVSVPNTGGQDNWVTINETIDLPRVGPHTISLMINSGMFDLNWMELHASLPSCEEGYVRNAEGHCVTPRFGCPVPLFDTYSVPGARPPINPSTGSHFNLTFYSCEISCDSFEGPAGPALCNIYYP